MANVELSTIIDQQALSTMNDNSQAEQLSLYVDQYLVNQIRAGRFEGMSNGELERFHQGVCDTFRVAGLHGGSWVDSIDALLEVQAISVENQRRAAGIRGVFYPNIWMLFDPCVTSKWKDDATASRFQEFLRSKHQAEKQAASELRRSNALRRKQLVDKRSAEGVGRLIDKITSIFASGLLRELRTANSIGCSSEADTDDGWEMVGRGAENEASLGGLFAKWSPTPGGMHDRALGLAPVIREKLVSKLRREENRVLLDKLLRTAAERTDARSDAFPIEHISFHRDILSPLRKMGGVPEHHIGAGTAKGGIDYTRMASLCRFTFGEKVFRRLDEENYDRFLLDAAKTALLKKLQKVQGKSPKVNAGALVPHEVMLRAVEAKSPVSKVEVSLQWQALVETCTQTQGSGKRLIIPMCDVSGSMYCPVGGSSQGNSTCLDVACALSLLLTDSLPENSAYFGKILTFDTVPSFVDLRPDDMAALSTEAIQEAGSLDELAQLIPDLAQRVAKLKSSPWGGSTDFFRAMRCICNIAIENGMKAEEMAGLELVVFSDMEFNQADTNFDGADCATMLESIRALFVNRFGPAAGEHLPKIVFWNLRASVSGSGVVERADEDGVALLSGYSSGLLRKYLEWDLDSPTPSLADSTVADRSSGKRAAEIGGSEPEAKRIQSMNPAACMMACLEDPLYSELRLEKDLAEWDVVVSEEEVMARAERVTGENGERVCRSNSSALVAFFFEAVPGIDSDELERLLEAAFAENPLVALKLLFNLGTVRKNAGGKADREGFQRALLWLWRRWPETYLRNVACIARFTSLKEMLNSAMFIVYEGERESDPRSHMLYSLEGQKGALAAHRARKRRRDGKARRKSRKIRRLVQWTEFAESEGRELFGDLRSKVGWQQLEQKLLEGMAGSCKPARDARGKEAIEIQLLEEAEEGVIYSWHERTQESREDRYHKQRNGHTLRRYPLRRDPGMHRNREADKVMDKDHVPANKSSEKRQRRKKLQERCLQREKSRNG